MTQPTSETRRIRCAVFVDFDNIFLGLQDQYDFPTARAFATAPREWLEWIERGYAAADEEAPDEERAILVRRCYMNPEMFGKYRPDFLNAGFHVVDCPPLTRRGKTSADIYMAVDALEALQHSTRFDEFVILSGDADFTPVLTRLRAHDRRTVVVTVGPTARPYMGAADLVIEENRYVEDALRVTPGEGGTGTVALAAEREHGDVLDQMALRVAEAVEAYGELEIGRVPALLRPFREFTASRNWVGFGSLRSLTEALLRRHAALEMDPESLIIRARDGAAPVSIPTPPSAPAPAAREAAPPAPEPAPAEPEAEAPPQTYEEAFGGESVEARIVEEVRSLVAGSDRPVRLLAAAAAVQSALGDVVAGSRWGGRGSLGNLLKRHEGAELRVALTPTEGWVLDPRRHEAPTEPAPEPSEQGDTWEDLPPDVRAFRERIHQLTSVPKLTSTELAMVFRALAQEVAENGYYLTTTARNVRERCAAAGIDLPRQVVSLVLTAVTYGGNRLGRGDEPESAVRLGEMYRDSVLRLTANAGVDLEREERALLDDWTMGGLAALMPKKPRGRKASKPADEGTDEA